VLGAVSEIRLGDKGPTIVKLARNRSTALEVVFFDKDVFLGSGLDARQGEYVVIRAKVAKYHDKARNQDRLQLVVALPGQVLEQTAELDKALEEPLPGLKPAKTIEAVPDEALDQLHFDNFNPDDVPIGRARPGAIQPD
jgi:hypothetical protein